MKTKITLFSFLLLLVCNLSYASFPVKRVATAETTTQITQDNEIKLVSPAASKNITTALLLFFFLWPFAAHRWYLGSPIGWNILFILTFGGLGIWAIVDLVDIITENYPGL